MCTGLLFKYDAGIENNQKYEIHGKFKKKKNVVVVINVVQLAV